MSKYGYPWPHIVRCDQFPVDNDMCIMPQHGLGGGVVGLPTSEESRRGGGGGGGGNSSSNLSQLVELYPDGTPKGIINQAGKKESTKKRRKSKKNRNIVSSTSSPFSAQDLTTGTLSSAQDLTTGTLSSSTSIPAPSHVHHHLQTMTEQQEMLLKASPPPTESGIHSTSISVGSNENKVHVQERILSGYCHSEWSLKVRATATRNPDDGSITLHVKSYRVLWGLLLPPSRPSLITVPANVSQEITSSSASSLASSSASSSASSFASSSASSSAFDGIRKHGKTSHHAAEDNAKTPHHTAEEKSSRFYVMGNTKGHQYLANFAIFWPHKSPHFR